MRVIEHNNRLKVDWQAVRSRNKGCICVEKDYQFPGGFYLRHKETPYYLTASRYDIECMIENALAALGLNTGPIIVPTREQADMINMMIQPTMEILDTHLPGANGWFLNLLWAVLGRVKLHPRAANIADGTQTAINGLEGQDDMLQR